MNILKKYMVNAIVLFQCSSQCGLGLKTRTVSCPSGDCPISVRPASQSSCDNGPCPVRGDIPSDGKSSSWYFTEWSHEVRPEYIII